MERSQRIPVSRLTLKTFVFFIAAAFPVTVMSQSCATGTVDERVAAYLKKAGPDKTMAQLKAGSIADIRNDGLSNFIRLPEDSVKRIRITNDNLKANVVKTNTGTNLPVVINFHPGGFVRSLSPDMEYEALRFAKKFNVVVFDIDYRVAPENKFPVASNDAYNAYTWVLEHAKEYGGDPGKIILNGKDAGGTLAALVALRAKRENKLQPIKLVIMNSAPTDNPMISYYDSFDANATGYQLTKDLSNFYVQAYLEKTEWFKADPNVWPFYEKEVAGLPPHLIITTEFDVLRDEGIAYGKKLEKAGNSVAIKCFPHQIHGFAGLPENSGEINRVFELMGESIANATK